MGLILAVIGIARLLSVSCGLTSGRHTAPPQPGWTHGRGRTDVCCHQNVARCSQQSQMQACGEGGWLLGMASPALTSCVVERQLARAQLPVMQLARAAMKLL